ncbi:MAG: transglycosylase domain-containing protein [Methylovulum sp.]|uniref:transglycosylase domain-containing protein n=1 Tax=Methylovulum sp. TaxID=1916980 RepID=UPI00260C8086|nr:transglycosylase domain-containing protein [Methylovulum sp.]MDD2723229.1 transglycosylase domain-containing protein [Methylovulum sp.]MDD5123170.1 transglycosylase domain-containing protein [Methylovulum sp.]
MATRRYGKMALRTTLAVLALLVLKTLWDIETPSLSLRTASSGTQRFQVLDRQGKPLGISYQNRFNTMAIVPLHAIPEWLRQAFVTSEDRQFFEHHGVNWTARASALWQNLRAGKSVRGASTITEQVVRIIHPRPRTLWSRWLEGFEAALLENHASKGELLEFYLNQVPYAANRRGVAQAARYYFNRDLGTLTHKEMLALAVLPRAPSALDLYKNSDAIEPAMTRLAQAMADRGELPAQERQQLAAQKLALEPPLPPLNASHFINYIRETIPYHLSDNGVLLTTLDGDLQHKAQDFLDERIKALQRKQVRNGAVMVVDHRTGEILVWAVGGAINDHVNNATPGGAIDAVRAPRQPGSSMKPFLYALALDAGWSPATELNDAPMAEAIGSGLHDFHNYSHLFYGKISLREALGNSLNIPALQTIAFVTPTRYLDTLHALGFASLIQPVEFYKEGLALGNGEVTLFEMVQAYSALASRGVFRSLTPLPQSPFTRKNSRVYSPEAASLIANILSDPFARRREFGAESVLNLPVQTAVKTGTSTDYHDAWVLGFDSHYAVGVWLGNLDQTPMDGITGSTGPALVLHSLFSELAGREKPEPLYLSPKLTQQEICTHYDQATGKNNCFPRTEYFIIGSEPNLTQPAQPSGRLELLRPTQGLQIAYDPRIPANVQAFEFVADGMRAGRNLEWLLNGKAIATTQTGHFLWPIKPGYYSLRAKETGDKEKTLVSDIVLFNVK